MGNKTFSEEELNTLSKDMIISLYLQLNSSFQLLSEQNKQMMKQLSDLQEQLAMLTNYRFGRKSEKTADELLEEARMREQKKRKKGVRE